MERAPYQISIIDINIFIIIVIIIIVVVVIYFHFLLDDKKTISYYDTRQCAGTGVNGVRDT